MTIAKKIGKPVVLHVLTVKGKGFAKAEESPTDYHGVSSFDIESGVASSKLDLSHVCGEKLLRMAEEDEKVCTVTAAMCKGTGLEAFAEKYPERFFDVGIAEEYAVTFASGLAKGGAKPYFAVYSTFLQRAYDEIIHDTAIAKLPVKFLVDRAGIVGEDGETHQGVFDAAFLTTIPNIEVYSPASYSELDGCLEATRNAENPIAIRYPRGSEDIKFKYYPNDFTVYGTGGRIAVVSYGIISSNVIKAQSKLVKEGKKFDFVKLNKIFPISDDLVSILESYNKIIVFEEGIKNGGIGEHLSGMVKRNVKILAVENGFIGSMSIAEARCEANLDTESMIKIIESEI